MFRRKKDEFDKPSTTPARESAPEAAVARTVTPPNPAPTFGGSGILKPTATVAPAAPVATPRAVSPAAPREKLGGESEVKKTEEKKLTVGPEIVLSGQITSCDRLVVEGRVEASLSDSRAIEIAESGFFKGTAEIDHAVIGGRFEGTLTVRERLTIRSTGRVQGKIRYGQIEIEPGGEISGEVQVAGRAPAGLKAVQDAPKPAVTGPAFPGESKLA
ncbi:MAG TPA: polymer-forming cytoskeletal protein [Alphaproteobacteria bacterium]